MTDQNAASANDIDLPGPSFFMVHAETQAQIATAQGLMLALREIASEYPGLNNPEPMANAILATMRALEGQLEKVVEAHDAEWPVGRNME